MNEDENSSSIQITNSDQNIVDQANEITNTQETEKTENTPVVNNETNNDNVISDTTTDDNSDESDESYHQNSVIFYLKRLFTVAFKTARTPFFMLSAFIKAADYKVALGFIIIQSLLFASSIASIMDSLNDLVNGVLTSITSGLNTDLYSSGAFSVAKSFFVTLILSTILLLVFASILHFFVTILLKTKSTYKQMLCVASSKCIAQIPFTVIAFIVSIFSPFTALFIAGLGTLLGLFFVITALKGLANVSENKIPYVAFLSFAVLAIITALLSKIILPLFLA